MTYLTDRYVNFFTDYGFKRLFGEEPNKDLLRDFLNELLKDEQGEIVELTYLKDEQLETRFEKWLYAIKHLDRLDKVPDSLRERVFEKFFEVAEIANFSREEVLKYEDSLKYYRDMKNSFDTARDEGREEGALEMSQRMLLKSLELKFGAMPESVVKKIGSITAVSRLESLFEEAYACQTVEAFFVCLEND